MLGLPCSEVPRVGLVVPFHPLPVVVRYAMGVMPDFVQLHVAGMFYMARSRKGSFRSPYDKDHSMLASSKTPYEELDPRSWDFQG